MAAVYQGWALAMAKVQPTSHLGHAFNCTHVFHHYMTFLLGQDFKPDESCLMFFIKTWF